MTERELYNWCKDWEQVDEDGYLTDRMIKQYGVR